MSKHNQQNRFTKGWFALTKCWNLVQNDGNKVGMAVFLVPMFTRGIYKTGQDKAWCSCTSSSKPRNTFGWRTKTCTSVPRPAKIPANSNAIYPPPTMQILLGLSDRFKASSEVMTCSLPGILGTVARPPTEIRMCLVAYFLPFTSTVCASTTYTHIQKTPARKYVRW